MRNQFLILLMFGMVGCKSISKISGSDSDPKVEPVRSMVVLACCRDNNDGKLSYPSFVPEAHVQACEVARRACRGDDCQIDGQTHLPTDGDCGNQGYKVGDEYYAGKGY